MAFSFATPLNQGTLVYSGLELFKTEDDVIFEFCFRLQRYNFFTDIDKTILILLVFCSFIRIFPHDCMPIRIYFVYLQANKNLKLKSYEKTIIGIRTADNG